MPIINNSPVNYANDTKDRPFGVAGQPVDGDLFSDTANLDPGQDPNDVITHPDNGRYVNLDYRNQPDPNDSILGSPAKFAANRLGYRGMKS
jgi:hypothetical protein